MEGTKTRPVRTQAKKKQQVWWKKTLTKILKKPSDTFSESTSAEKSGRSEGGFSEVLAAFSGDDLNTSSEITSHESDREVGINVGHIPTSDDSSDISVVLKKRPKTNLTLSDSSEERGQICSTPVRPNHDILKDAPGRHSGGKENEGEVHSVCAIRDRL